VVDAGSFVGASDALEMSKAAVSRHVADLESRLSVRLLHRTTRKLSLTAEGEVFYARCRELLDSVEEAEAEITSSSGEASGALRVNVPLSFGLLHLAPLWVEFMNLRPKVTLDVTLDDRIVDWSRRVTTSRCASRGCPNRR
jgi:DNA-binding transcriptional LysR family regulator